MARIVLIAFLLGIAQLAPADEIQVLAGSAIQPVMTPLAAQFERQSGHRLRFDYGTVGGMAQRAGKGEVADAVVVSEPQFDRLVQEGRALADTRVVLGKTGVGVFVKKGAPRPDIASVESFKASMLAAKSIGFNDPAAGAPVSLYLLDLFKRMGIAEAMGPKTVAFKQRSERFDAVARGDVEIGFNQVSEIVAVPSVDLVGPLPESIQNYTVLTAGLLASAPHPEAARQLISFLRSAAVRSAFAKGGFDVP